MEVEFISGHGLLTNGIKVEHFLVEIKRLVDVINFESYLTYVRVGSS